MRNHASILCCTHIVGYTETCTIHGDVCVLISIGTAAVVKVFYLVLFSIILCYFSSFMFNILFLTLSI